MRVRAWRALIGSGVVLFFRFRQIKLKMIKTYKGNMIFFFLDEFENEVKFVRKVRRNQPDTCRLKKRRLSD